MRLWRGFKAWAAGRYGRALWWGLASALALPPVHLLPVLLFAVPALVRLSAGAGGWRQALLVGWLFGFGTNVGGLYWLTEPELRELADFWWFVPFADPSLSALLACFLAPAALAAYLAPAGWPRVLIFSGVWVLGNLAQEVTGSGFPWNMWGTDWAMPGLAGDVFIQLARVVGVHGLTLATMLLACMPLMGRRGLLLLVVGLAAWAGFGVWHLERPVFPSAGIKVALLQPDFPVPGSYDRASLFARWHQLEAMTAAGFKAGANVVVWPEGNSPWLLDSDEGAREQLAQAVGDKPVIAGSSRWLGGDDYRNSIVVTKGAGAPVAIYDKWKLVPWGEYTPKWVPLKITPSVLGTGFTAGTGPKTLHIPGLPAVGALICYEAIFSGIIVNERDRPSWLVNVTDDSWFGESAGPWQHFADVRLRAVEEGLPLARAANGGITAMIDPFGRVMGFLPLETQGVLVMALPGSLPPGLYCKLGLWVSFLLSMAVVITGLLIFAFRRVI